MEGKMDKFPLVSAIVTTYKRPIEIVQKALQSIVNQDYENIEIILVNDAPEEEELSVGLENLSKSFPRKIQYIKMKQNSGACAARNKGIERATGEFIAFLDDDDEWCTQKIRKQVFSFNDIKIGLSYCNFWIKEEGKEIRIRTENLLPSGKVFNQLLEKNHIGSSSFPMIRKSVAIDAGLFNLNMPALQDWDFWLRVTQRCETVYLDEPLGIYYFYKGDRISSYPEKRIKGFENIFRQYKDYFEKNSNIQANYIAEGITFYVNGGDFKSAISLYKKMIFKDKKNIKRNIRILVKIIVRFFSPAKIV